MPLSREDYREGSPGHPQAASSGEGQERGRVSCSPCWEIAQGSWEGVGRASALPRGSSQEQLRARCRPGPFLCVCPPSFVTTNCALQFSSRGVRPGLTTVLARNLDKNTVGYLQWRWGIQSAMNTSIVRDTKSGHFTVALQVRTELREDPSSLRLRCLLQPSL